MKQQIGTITEYNGYGGKIQSNNQEYLLLNTNIIEKENSLQPNDEVEFIPEKEKQTNIARFVRKRTYPKQ